MPNFIQVSRRQFYQQLAVDGTITEAEAIAAMAGSIPAVLLGLVSQLPTEQQFPAQMHLAGSNTFDRFHPLTSAIAAAQEKSDEDVDAFFRAAGAL